MSLPSAPVAPAESTAIAGTVDAIKVYGIGRHRGPRPRRGDRRVRARSLHGDHGPVGLGQVHADALRRRARRPHLGRVYIGDVDLSDLSATRSSRCCAASASASCSSRSTSCPTLTALENITLPMDLAGTQARPGVARQRDQHGRPARPAQAPAERAVRRPAAARRRRPSARQPARRSSSPTSPPATSTRRPGRRSSRSCARPSPSWARRS